MHPVPGMTVFYSRKETRTSLELTHERDDSIRTLVNRSPLRHSSRVLLALACWLILQSAQAVVPPPDGGYAGGNTAEGQAAL
jgi:hypothetical protein